ncbi:hypothetical protein [Shewanella phaeophyticola]|uniref:Uncharacterized protein n=1 Tax=Shewanella phaeophyticola TaxID=2978345 RepID=A0ABT2P412_9GAMM|nr:hypothetical protein [Shewanella sp. KJ10-1]MCT8987391.1 hypothetical protein [Shewanella sp. KJ10-1]
MTFPWVRIVLMLVIVGLSSFFLINSRVLILPSSHSSAPQLSSISSPACTAPFSCEPKKLNQSTDVTQISSAAVINIDASRLGYVGKNNLNPDITPVTDQTTFTMCQLIRLVILILLSIKPMTLTPIMN